MQKKSFFIIEKIKKYLKCPALGHCASQEADRAARQDDDELCSLTMTPAQGCQVGLFEAKFDKFGLF